MPRMKQSAHKHSRGGASSSRSQRSLDFDHFRFTSAENAELFAKVGGNAMIVEKSIDPRVDQGVPLRGIFDRFGWGSLLDITGPYYPGLVWQFFANMEDKDKIDIDGIRTYVKGVPVVVSSEFLASILNVPNAGPPVIYNNYDRVTSDLEYDLVEASQRLNYRRVRTGSRRSILPTYLPLIDRLICYFISANIIPRKAGNNEVRNLNVYIVDKLLNGLGEIEAIPVAAIMIAHMRFVAHAATTRQTGQHAPFPIIISRILAYAGVDFSDEPSFHPTSRHMLTATAMSGMYFIQRRGLWYRNPASQNITRHPRDPPVPAATDAEVAREERVGEEEEIDRAADSPPPESRQSPRTPRGTRRVFSALFDCMDELRTGQAQIIHFARTGLFSDDVRAPPFNRSSLDDLDETESSEEE